MRNTLIEFMDKLREYVAESGTNIAHDERDSSEFVDIFLNKWQSLSIDSDVGQSEQLSASLADQIKKGELDPYSPHAKWVKP